MPSIEAQDPAPLLARIVPFRDADEMATWRLILNRRPGILQDVDRALEVKDRARLTECLSEAPLAFLHEHPAGTTLAANWEFMDGLPASLAPVLDPELDIWDLYTEYRKRPTAPGQVPTPSDTNLDRIADSLDRLSWVMYIQLHEVWGSISVLEARARSASGGERWNTPTREVGSMEERTSGPSVWERLLSPSIVDDNVGEPPGSGSHEPGAVESNAKGARLFNCRRANRTRLFESHTLNLPRREAKEET